MARSAPRLISVFPSPQELGASLAQLVVQRATQCGADAGGPRGRFFLGVSGGSLVGLLAQELPRAAASEGPAAPDRWTLGFCDERLVGFADPESTYGQYRTHLLSKLPIPESQVITINPTLSVEAAAADYAEKLREAFQGDSIPVFDLLILGIGPDGHTCSLFPDHPLLQPCVARCFPSLVRVRACVCVPVPPADLKAWISCPRLGTGQDLGGDHGGRSEKDDDDNGFHLLPVCSRFSLIAFFPTP
ncbi:6-phosphogluconolactonase isoform X2 [Ornithorhynchus anatinus]|uniref:6-phosphogluconolactonase isoform X2 n=1 Tax=Ornithorhynchus anatinus TaxID=9258 RepID=UPI0010A7C894|nr:6-phosphogluconolactonase isoform X2 [Ornithorhynchus anatinus]